MGDPIKAPGLSSIQWGVPQSEVLSTADLPQEEEQKLIKAREDALASLEQRYAQPNWFKVAAGFLKPQLGGFGASLGSASDALGENIEQQRAIAPTIAVERAKLAQMQSMMGKNERGANLAGEILGLGPNSGRTLSTAKDLTTFITPDNINKVPAAIGRLAAAGQTDLAKSLEAAQTAYKGTIESRTAETGLSAAEQERIRLNPTYVPKLNDSLPIGSREQQDNLAAQLRSSLIGKGIDESQVKTAGLAQLQAINDNVMQEQAKKRFETLDVSGKEADQARDQLVSLSEARTLASKEGIKKLLGMGAGQSALSALLGYIQNTTDTTGSALTKSIAQLKATDPEAYSDFQTLEKILSRNLMGARAAMRNPSVSSTMIAAQSNPSKYNSQDALLKMIDLMAHEEANTYREYKIKEKHKGDPYKMREDLEKLHDMNLDERTSIVSKPSIAGELPSFYRLSNAVMPANNPTAPVPVSNGERKPPKGWHKLPNGHFEKD